MAAYALNVYEYDSTKPSVYTCHFVTGDVREAVEKAFRNLLLDFTEEDLEDMVKYLQEEGECDYFGGHGVDAYTFKVESI